MPYSCTSVLRDCPIYINASVISVLFPDAMSRTLGSETKVKLPVGVALYVPEPTQIPPRGV